MTSRPNAVMTSRRLLFSALGLSLAAGAVLGALAAVGLQPSPWLASIVAIAVVVATFWYAWLWWRSVDEAVREAHKTGWYWGGSAGLAAAGAILAGLFFVDPAVSLDRYAMMPGDAGLILTGLFLTIGLQLLGYVAVWAGWWLLRGR